jgi:hypothetical protein
MNPALLVSNDDQARARIGARLYETNVPQMSPQGLNFGYFYVSTLSGTKPSDLKKESN